MVNTQFALRYYGGRYPKENSFTMIDESVFVAGGLPRIWKGQLYNGGTIDAATIPLEKCDFITPLRNFKKGLGEFDSGPVFLNVEHVKASTSAVFRPWVEKMIRDTRTVFGADTPVGQFDNRLPFDLLNLFDFHVISAQFDGSLAPLGYEKPLIEGWIRQRHKQIYDTYNLDQHKPIYPMIDVGSSGMDGAEIRHVLGLLAAMPSGVVSRLGLWTWCSSDLEFVHAQQKMDDIQTLWARLVAARNP